MFQKIIGITGILAVIGTIVMAALSPRTEGFFPGLFDFLKRAPQTETIETGTICVPEPTVPQVDTLRIELQTDTVSIE